MPPDPRDPLLQVRTSLLENDRSLVVLEGEVDVTSADQVTAAVDGLLDAGSRAVEVDFAAVTFMDSSGLGAVIHAHRAARHRGATLVFGPRSAIVDRLFEVSGVERALASE